METIVRRIGLVAHDAMKKDMIEWVLDVYKRQVHRIARHH